MALGGEETAVWTSETIEIPVKGVLVLYTDGVVDARGQAGSMYGEQRLVETMSGLAGSTAQMVKERLFTDLRSFAGDGGQFDDIAFVAIKREKVRPIRRVERPVYGREVL